MVWTVENIQWYFQQPPPRPLDSTLLREALDILFPRMVRILFYILPMLMLSISGVLLAFLIQHSDLKSEWRLMTEPVMEASGKVIEVEQIKGSKGSITYLYQFQFRPVGREGPSDPPVKGISFASDRVAAPGETVRIDYLPNDHRVNRIKGCRVSFHPLELMAMIPFLGIITGIVPWGMISYKKRTLQRLITLGLTASAMIEKIKPGAKGTLVVEVRYTLGGTELQARTNTSGGKEMKEWLMSLQQGGRNVLILVDLEKPKRIFMVELLLNAKRVKLPGRIS